MIFSETGCHFSGSCSKKRDRVAVSLRDRSDGFQILGGRLAGLAVDHDLERNTLAFTQLTQAGTLDGADMDEHVLAAAFRLDKSVTLLRVEPFDGSVAHGRHSFEESRFESR